MDHSEHGRGDAESGPDDSGCSCTGTDEQSACDAAGCGFCIAARGPSGPYATEAEAQTFVGSLPKHVGSELHILQLPNGRWTAWEGYVELADGVPNPPPMGVYWRDWEAWHAAGELTGLRKRSPSSRAVPDAERGAYRKFKVERTDGSSALGGKHARCRYFVLDLDHDPHAAPALHAYAESCHEAFPELASDLRYAAAQLANDGLNDKLPGEGVDLGFKKGHVWGEDEWGRRA